VTAESAPRRRGRRVLAVVASWLVGSAVVLGAMVWIGNRLGANPLPGQRVAAGTTGSDIYGKNCAACHGLRGEGGSLDIKGPAFTAGGALADLTFDERVAKIGRGKPLNGMPRWSTKLSAADIRKVAAYTQSLSGQTPDPSVEDVGE
jgi:mono/diheme cytochrome c family protein